MLQYNILVALIKTQEELGENPAVLSLLALR